LLISRLAQCDVTLRSDGDNVIINGPDELVTNALIREIRAAKAEILAALTKGGAADLRYLYHERAGICEDGGQNRARAETRAWNQVASHWHRQHGTRNSDDLGTSGKFHHKFVCAGCGQPLDGAPNVVLFPHGERAHADDGFDCIRRYIARWRSEAATALSAIGIPTPREIEVAIAGAKL
jgi:hypothetical protein